MATFRQAASIIGMNSTLQRNITRARLAAGAFFVVWLPACAGVAGLDPYAGTTVSLPADPKRAAAVAEMRAMAEAGDQMPYPDRRQRESVQALAARPEPRAIPDVRAIETELAAIAERRAATSNAVEIAALDARARELRRLAVAAGQPDLR